MVEKFKDAANILKAKLKKDDLEESLVQATSEQNWQAPTTLLHEIANASYNYQKCQQINEFIWDKLKKKQSWRKILKTLNLVDFLLKNGPPSLISSYKYELYHFKSFFDYSHVSAEGVDRGQSIREKSKAIVELLTNEQILEQQRTKAKTIRERMSGITGGFSAGDSKYQGYDSKSYGRTGAGEKNYGQGSMNSAYGDYNYNTSTLDKYKDKEKGKDSKVVKSSTNQRMVEPEFSKPDIITQEVKKPFEKEAPKLMKPGQKPQTPLPQSTSTATTIQNKPSTQKPKASLMDDDIFGFSQPIVSTSQNTTPSTGTVIAGSTQQQQPSLINPMYGTTAPLAAQNIQQTQSLNFVNPMYGTTAPLAAQSAHSAQLNFINPMYGTTAPMVAQQNSFQNMNLVNPMYGTTAPMAAQQTNQPPQLNFINPMYPTTAPLATNPNPYSHHPQPQPQPQWSFTPSQPPASQYINPMYSQTAPMAQQSLTLNQPITLAQKKNDDEFGHFQSATNTNTKNVAWLSEKEQGLIDFSDFGAEVKKSQKSNTAGKAAGSAVSGSNWDW